MSHNLASKPTMRRGPTVRGGRRPTIGRVGLRRRSSASDQEILAKSDSDTATEEVELHEVDQPPVYKHGDETFGDIITHPVQQYEAHKQRKAEYEEHRASWALEHGLEKDEASLLHPHDHTDFVTVIHFRNLRAEQNFAIDYDTATEFGRKLKLTQNEKIMLNGVHDTESLTSFLHNTRRDYAIKVHHGHGGDHHQQAHQILELSSNIYIEFKPKYHDHSPPQSSFSTRRPFFLFPEPDLSADIGEEKAASWLELFYDLFYIASLSEFTHTHVIKDWSSLGVYTSWFVIMWWAWTASSLYTSRFDTDDVMHHIWKLIEMCAVIGMAGTSDHFLNSPGFVYGYIALKAVLAVEYSIVFAVALMAKSKSRIPLLCYVITNVISIILWGISLLFIDNNSHFALWYVGLFVELVVNLIVKDKRLSWAASHLAERFGLLTLIVLGENLMGFVKLVAEAGTTIYVVIPNFMAVVIIFGFFFNYFEDFSKEVMLHSRNHQLWVYLHFPLHLCQVAFGIALINMLRIYKLQYEKDHGEGSVGGSSPANESSPSEPSSTGSAAAPGSSVISPGGHPAKRDTTTPEQYANEGHELAARAVNAVGGSPPNLYSPISPLPSSAPSSVTTYLPTMTSSILTTAATMTASAAYSTLSIIHSNAGEAVVNSTASSGAASANGEVELTPQEQTFIYKTFLITGGLIMTINSLIKLLNTKVHDIYGKIIILCRILNAIILWSICALPFTQLSALLLISIMTGSLVLQALVDLLD